MQTTSFQEQIYEIRRQIVRMDAKLDIVLEIVSGVAGDLSGLDSQGIADEWLRQCEKHVATMVAEYERQTRSEPE